MINPNEDTKLEASKRWVINSINIFLSQSSVKPCLVNSHIIFCKCLLLVFVKTDDLSHMILQTLQCVKPSRRQNYATARPMPVFAITHCLARRKRRKIVKHY